EHSDREDRKVDISIEQTDEICALLVEDNGSGIEESILPKIYEKGFTANKSGGTGYGLYLVKQIAEKGGGAIEVSTSKDEGSSFTIIFPMEAEGESYGG